MENHPNGHEPIQPAAQEGPAKGVAEAPQTPAPKTPDIRMIRLEELMVPDWNPRVFIDEQEMMNLVEYLRTGGSVPRIEVWENENPPDPRHQAEGPIPKEGMGAPYPVISGQRRLIAARRLGWTHIEAEVMHITLREAKARAITSNQGAEVYWLDKYIRWEAYGRENEGLTQEQIAGELGVDSNLISRQTRLMTLLTPAAREAIRKSLKPLEIDPLKNKGNWGVISSSDYTQKTLKNEGSSNSKPGVLTELVAYRLIKLWDKRSLAEAQELATAAIPVILDQRLSGPQVDALVAWVNAGNSPANFEPTAKVKKPKASEGRAQGEPTSIPSQTGVRERAEGASSGLGETEFQERGMVSNNPKVTPVEKSQAEGVPTSSSSFGTGTTKPIGSAPRNDRKENAQPSAPAAPASGPQAKISESVSSAGTGAPGGIELMGWDLLAGISILKQLRQKVKAGHRPAFWEALALIALFLGEAAVSLWKHVGKPAWRVLEGLLKKSFRLAFKLTKESVKDVLRLFGRTFYNIARVVLFILVLGFMAWLVYDTVVHHGFRPLAVLEEFVDFVVQAVKFLWRVV